MLDWHVSTTETSTKITVSRLMQAGLNLGIFLLVLGWIGAYWHYGRSPFDIWFRGAPLMIVRDIGIGLTLGVLISGTAFGLTAQLPYLKRIRETLTNKIYFKTMRGRDVVVLSLLAAVPEEVFFRGMMQPILGLILTAFIFGLLHALTPTYFAYATLMGFVLGGMAEMQGHLWMAMATHFSIDFVSFVLLIWWTKRQADPIPRLDSDLHPTVRLDR